MKNVHFHLAMDEKYGRIRVWRSNEPDVALISSPLLQTGAWPFCEELAKKFPAQFVLNSLDNSGKIVCKLCEGSK